MTDLEAMFAAVLRGPADNLARLVYADALDESGEDAARAELIRVQCGLSALRESRPSECDEWHSTSQSPLHWCPLCAWDEKQSPLVRREFVLLAANRDRWLRVPCAKCVNGYEKHPKTGEVIEQWCRTCDRTGDAGGLTWALRVRTADDDGGVHESSRAVAVEFRRGWPSVVWVPRLSDCVGEECTACGRVGCSHNVGTRPVPAPWLAAVAAHHPLVEEVVPLDREPEDVGYGFCWRDGGLENGPENVPTALFVDEVRLVHATANEARVALSRQIIKFAHSGG